MGVVYAPSFNRELFHAVRGKGAFLNDKPLRMNAPDQDMEATIVATGFAYLKGEALNRAMKTHGTVLNQCTDIVRFGSAALDLCQVAAGRIGGYYELDLKPWDVAAGALILEEQGGTISDYNGHPLNLFTLERLKGSFQ